MTVEYITKIIEKNAPREIALSFDNVGLLTGDAGSEVLRIAAAVDVTDGILDKAINIGANLLITHHPLIFNPIKSVNSGDYVSELLLKAIRAGINIYACHTNADNAPRGLNYSFLKALGADNIRVLMPDGSGCVGDICCDFDELASRVKSLAGGIIRSDKQSEIVERAAVITGSGGRDTGVIAELKKLGADCYITGEVAHHFRLELMHCGIGLIEIGHYESEKIFIDIVGEWLKGSGAEVIGLYDDRL